MWSLLCRSHLTCQNLQDTLRLGMGVMTNFARDPKHLGADTGMITILHTWGQNLSLHPHIHCIVPAGGLTSAGHWKTTRTDGKFLFPVKAMSQVFRARFVATLRSSIKNLPRSFYYLQRIIPNKLGSVCQTSLWWTKTSGGIPGTIHSQDCHLQSSLA
jgi:hypothetical protein